MQGTHDPWYGALKRQGAGVDSRTAAPYAGRVRAKVRMRLPTRPLAYFNRFEAGCTSHAIF